MSNTVFSTYLFLRGQEGNECAQRAKNILAICCPTDRSLGYTDTTS